MATIKVRNGGLSQDVVVGDSATVADVREAITGTLGLSDGAKAFLTRAGNVNAVGDEYATVVLEGDQVEFMKPSGSKG
jgi:hypothetical protein